MKVLKHGESKQIKCEWCNSVLEYEGSDIYYGEFGCAFIDCPVCKTKIELPDLPMGLTVDNVRWPQHFSHMSDKAAHLSDDQVQTRINECLKVLKNEEPGDYAFSGTGDTMVFAFKFEDEYAVYVTQNYFETSIPIVKDIDVNPVD